MSANYMLNALKHPHPEAPFSQYSDDMIRALAQLATIFKKISKTNIARTYPSTSQGH
jgi:hypothetical protein